MNPFTLSADLYAPLRLILDALIAGLYGVPFALMLWRLTLTLRRLPRTAPAERFRAVHRARRRLYGPITPVTVLFHAQPAGSGDGCGAAGHLDADPEPVAA